MHFWFRLEHFNSSGLDLSLSLIILRIQLCVRKDLHAVSSILIQSSQKQNQSKLYHINIFLHSLWILWASTGLGCKLKKIDRKKNKNMVSHFPAFVRASAVEGQRQLRALSGRMTALKYWSSGSCCAVWHWGQTHLERRFGASIPVHPGGWIKWLRAGNQSGCQKANVSVTRLGENSTVFCIFV